MKNRLIDLNNHLFAQLERLSDEDMTGEKLGEEMEKSKAIGGVAKNIIDNAKLALEAQKAFYNDVRNLPEMLGVEQGNGDSK